MKCPDCGVEVDPQQDFCLECGEPIAGMKAAGAIAAPIPVPAPAPAPEPPKAAAKPKPRFRRDEEPEPIRCPGCGVPSRRARCPSCGTRLRSDDD